MSLDLEFIRNLIVLSKNDIFQIKKELGDLKSEIKEEIKELKEFKNKVVHKESKSNIEGQIEKDYYGIIKLEEGEIKNDFCDITLTCDEEEIHQFKCDECPEQFMLRDHLKSHKRTHTEIRIFSCYICRELFSSKHEFEEQLLRTSYKFSIEYSKLKALKDGVKESRHYLAKQDQNFIFQVF